MSCEYWQGAVRAPFFLGSVSSLLLLPRGWEYSGQFPLPSGPLTDSTYLELLAQKAGEEAVVAAS